MPGAFSRAKFSPVVSEDWLKLLPTTSDISSAKTFSTTVLVVAPTVFVRPIDLAKKIGVKIGLWTPLSYLCTSKVGGWVPHTIRSDMGSRRV